MSRIPNTGCHGNARDRLDLPAVLRIRCFFLTPGSGSGVGFFPVPRSSTYISERRVHKLLIYIRAPQCMSPRRNWDSPNRSPASECALPPRTKGWGAHSPAAKGVGSLSSDDWRKSLAICLLCGLVAIFWEKLPKIFAKWLKFFPNHFKN
jgi:hypothetical protein